MKIISLLNFFTNLVILRLEKKELISKVLFFILKMNIFLIVKRTTALMLFLIIYILLTTNTSRYITVYLFYIARTKLNQLFFLYNF